MRSTGVAGGHGAGATATLTRRSRSTAARRLAVPLLAAGLAAAFGGQRNEEAPVSGWLEIGAGLPAAGSWRNGFDLADLDGDGTLDLVHGPPRRGDGRPRIFRGRGDGSFRPEARSLFPELPFDYGDAASADFDGDGRPDLAFGVHLRGLVTLLQQTDGSFAVEHSSLSQRPGEPVFSSRALAVGDLDGDGRPDLAAMGEGPRLDGRSKALGARVLLNRLPAPWEWRELQPAEGRLFADDLTIADFDGNGNTDLVGASRVRGQRGVVFWGDEGGSFATAELLAARADSFFFAVAAADFDATGPAALAVAYFRSRNSKPPSGIDLLRASGDRMWTRDDLPWPARLGNPFALATGDPDGDGDPDLVALSDRGAVALFANRSGELTLGETLALERAGRGCAGYHVQLGDLDGDGDDEIVAGFAGEDCPGGGSLRAWDLRSEPDS